MPKPTRLFTTEHVVTMYHHRVPADVSLKQILEPSYWAHVAYQFKPGFRVVCDSEDGTWTATLHCRSVGKVEAFMSIENFVEFSSEKKKVDTGPYRVEWRGGTSRWAVVTGSEQNVSVIKDGFDMEEQAIAWVEGHLARTQSEKTPAKKTAAA